MIERDIEAAVTAKISALGIEGLDVGGYWQPAGDGRAKGLERPEHSAVVRVAVAPRSFDSFSTPVANFPVSVALAVRRDLSPGGEALAEFAAPLALMMQTWQSDVDAVKNDFSVKGFSPCGLRLDGGDAGADDSLDVWHVVQRFTVRGTITEKQK